MTEYANRDIRALDSAGNYYSKHVEAMTTEGLHDKSDIAAELGYRDMRIVELEKVFADEFEMLKEIRNLQNAVRELAAANAWQNFGECRAFTETRMLKPHELDMLARDVLGI